MKHATAFAESLGLSSPIFQAPVGGVAGPELAAAVSEAGGMGALDLTWTSPEDARRLIAEIRAKTERPVQANFVLAFDEQSLAAALEAGVRVITISWGLPVAEVPLLKSFGARFDAQATTAEGSRQGLELGADFLVCQGIEAGGHVRDTRSLDEVLPDILEAAHGTPVIATGCPPSRRRPGEGDCIASEPGGRDFHRYVDTPPRATMQGNPEAMCLYAGTS